MAEAAVSNSAALRVSLVLCVLAITPLARAAEVAGEAQEAAEGGQPRQVLFARLPLAPGELLLEVVGAAVGALQLQVDKRLLVLGPDQGIC